MWMVENDMMWRESLVEALSGKPDIKVVRLFPRSRMCFAGRCVETWNDLPSSVWSRLLQIQSCFEKHGSSVFHLPLFPFRLPPIRAGTRKKAGRKFRVPVQIRCRFQKPGCSGVGPFRFNPW